MNATVESVLEPTAIEATPFLPYERPSQLDQPRHELMTQRRVLTLAMPIIGENLLQTLVGAVDTFMVARLGAAAVAGVGIGFELVFFIISILSAIDIGATVLVSQA
ncbi:MAG TPA: MATE family efflux transporter, partial [Thermomicrobiales bacterium]|nr:MATE family efflux transporter [Thermomicrobiales bacterium]